MIRKYFASANSAGGFANLMDNNLSGIKTIYAVSGSSKKQKSELLEAILKKAESTERNIECVVNPFDIKNIDAVIMKDRDIAVVDKECIFHQGEARNIDLDEVTPDAPEIGELSNKAKWAFDELYRCYEKAKKVHDEWEKIYIQNMDFKRLEAYEKGICEQLIAGRKGTPQIENRHRFFGASTPDGSVNYIDNLTENLSARYFIKGRPGTGKSTFLKRLVKEANLKGFDTEIYYCSFDEKSLDMVIVPELDFCVFDSTAPHEMFPQSEKDKILDFYQESGLLGVDEMYEKELAYVGERYKHKIAEGMAFLRLGKLYMKEKEYYLSQMLDEKKFFMIKEKVISEIFK